MRNYETEGRCPIWDSSAKVKNVPDKKGMYVDSPRAGGKYFIFENTVEKVNELDDKKKALLTTWLINQRSLGKEHPEIEEKTIDEATSRQALRLAKRLDGMLSILGEKPGILDVLNSDQIDRDRYLAYSESTTSQEISDLLQYLEESALIKNLVHGGLGSRGCKITAKGIFHLEKLRNQVSDSSKAFVAMWFDESMNKVLEEGIEPAIEDAGYLPVRIDKKEYNDKIDDEIIAEIKRSLFLVADFTHGESGARGGVYYEAGFAHGLGKQVIFTCEEGSEGEIHFDTRQYNHILWKRENLKKLREELANRISATIGDGPRKQVSEEKGTTLSE